MLAQTLRGRHALAKCPFNNLSLKSVINQCMALQEGPHIHGGSDWRRECLERAVEAVPIDQTGSDIKRDSGTDQVR
jgi:hypothetical protein